MPDTETIGAAILRTRTERGQTQTEAAVLMGTTQQSVARWEAGDVPAIRKRAGVARYLGWSLTQVVDACVASVEAARENTDRAQVAALGEATPATIQDSLMVQNTGWRGHLPLCRGPGGIMARRMAALVRGRR